MMLTTRIASKDETRVLFVQDDLSDLEVFNEVDHVKKMIRMVQEELKKQHRFLCRRQWYLFFLCVVFFISGALLNMSLSRTKLAQQALRLNEIMEANQLQLREEMSVTLAQQSSAQEMSNMKIELAETKELLYTLLYNIHSTSSQISNDLTTIPNGKDRNEFKSYQQYYNHNGVTSQKDVNRIPQRRLSMVAAHNSRTETRSDKNIEHRSFQNEFQKSTSDPHLQDTSDTDGVRFFLSAAWKPGENHTCLFELKLNGQPFRAGEFCSKEIFQVLTEPGTYEAFLIWQNSEVEPLLYYEITNKEFFLNVTLVGKDSFGNTTSQSLLGGFWPDKEYVVRKFKVHEDEQFEFVWDDSFSEIVLYPTEAKQVELAVLEGHLQSVSCANHSWTTNVSFLFHHCCDNLTLDNLLLNFNDVVTGLLIDLDPPFSLKSAYGTSKCLNDGVYSITVAHSCCHFKVGLGNVEKEVRSNVLYDDPMVTKHQLHNHTFFFEVSNLGSHVSFFDNEATAKNQLSQQIFSSSGCEDGIPFNLYLTTDRRGNATSWTLWDVASDELLMERKVGYYNGSSRYHEKYCLEKKRQGKYSFTINDEGNNGISLGGGYRITVGSRNPETPRNFKTSFTHKFNIIENGTVLLLDEPLGQPCNSEATLEIVVNLHGKPQDIDWELIDTSVNTRILERRKGTHQMPSTSTVNKICLEPERTYRFMLSNIDTDALQCNYDSCYQLVLNKSIIASGKYPSTVAYHVIEPITDRRYGPSHFVSKSGPLCDVQPVLSGASTLLSSNSLVFEDRTTRGVETLRTMSGQSIFNEYSSSQYKAACYILFDDFEKRDPSHPHFIQRYIIALLIYSWGIESQEAGLDMLWRSTDEVTSTRFFHGNAKGDITHIEDASLTEVRVSGSIPSEIAYLQELEYMLFWDESLSGTIPSEVANLQKLKHLIINNCNISGTLPSELFLLPNLDYLELNGNSISGTIPNFNENNHLTFSLRLLDLGQNMISGTIPKWIFQNKNFEVLSLGSNSLTGSLSPDIGQLSNLVELLISQNLLAGKIPIEALKSLRFLGFVDLSENGLTGTIPEAIFSEVTQEFWVDCTNWFGTKKVSCNDCTCTARDNSWYPSTSDTECSGSKMDIRVAKMEVFRTRAFWRVPGRINEWSEARVKKEKEYYCVPMIDCFQVQWRDSETGISIQIDDRQIFKSEEGSGLANIGYNHTLGGYGNLHNLDDCSSVRQLCEDEMLHDTAHHAKGEIAADQSYSASKHPRDDETVILEHIAQFAGKETFLSKVSKENSSERHAFCATMQYYLTTSEVDKSKLSAEDGKLQQHFLIQVFLESALGKVWDVKTLMDDDVCSGDIGVVCKGGFVTKLVLPGRNLEGTIPTYLGLLESLEVIDLSNNKIRGTIPSELGRLKNLREFILSNNQVTGIIPEQLSQSLNVLDVSSNFLKGPLPESIGGLNELRTFNASFNLVDNNLPKSWNACRDKSSNLEILDLRYNKISGEIPENLYSCSNLKSLHLSKNNVEGRLSGKIGGLRELSHLSMDENSLSGSIPNQLSLLSSLKEVKLHYNNLKGSIPNYLVLNENLKRLWLHGNKLTGTTPEVTSSNARQDFNFIADCGGTVGSESALTCPGFQVCCNEDEGKCLINEPDEGQRLLWIGLFVILAIVAVIVLLGLAISTPFLTSLTKKSACKRMNSRMLCGNNSVYWFLLCDNYQAWVIYVITVGAQIAVFWVFIASSLLGDSSREVKYILTCPEGSETGCEDARKYVNTHGWIVYGILMFIYVGYDVINGIRLMSRGIVFMSMRHFVSGLTMLSVSALAVWTSTVYNMLTAATNATLMINAVILLFINDMDERMFVFCSNVFPGWTKKLATNADDFEQKVVKSDEDEINVVAPLSNVSSTEGSNNIQPRDNRLQETNIASQAALTRSSSKISGRPLLQRKNRKQSSGDSFFLQTLVFNHQVANQRRKSKTWFIKFLFYLLVELLVNQCRIKVIKLFKLSIESLKYFKFEFQKNMFLPYEEKMGRLTR